MQQQDFVGHHVGEFVVRERIGRGGMAAVYRAWQQSVNRDVALKIIWLDESLEAKEFRQRFAQEAKVIASLEHIHILPIYSYGIDQDVAYIAMRLLRGGSLGDKLRDGPLSTHEAITLFGQVARGLSHAHSKGVIHRDLKPSNILLDEVGNAYLSDFGLAKLSGDPTEITKTGSVVGTPAYMSPEQLRGDPLDHRSDIYSMGVVLYHMLCGQPPFDSPSGDVVSIIYKHLEKAPVPPSELNPHIPPELEAVVLRALSKDPNGRYDSAGEMSAAAKRAVGISTNTTYPAVSPNLVKVSGTRSWTSPRWQRIWLGLLIFVIILAVLAGLLMVGANNTASTLATETAAALASLPTSTSTPEPRATVLVGESGGPEDAVPSAGEIAAAQQRLGPDGFIAYIACTQSSEFHSTQAREMRDFAARYGMDFRVYDANADDYQQLTLVERARTEGASALIICLLNEDLMHDSLRSIEESHIPLVLLADPKEKYGGVTLNSVGDNYQMGLEAGGLAGQIIRDEMGGHANVIILDFPEMSIIVQRANGLQDGLLKYAPNATIVGRYLGGTRDNGYNSVKKLLQDGVDFNVIASINDAGSLGAIQALEEADIPDDQVVITSIDAEVLAVQYVRTGHYLRGTLTVGRREIAQAAIDAITKLLAGASLPENILVHPGNMITQETLAEETPEPTLAQTP